MAPIRLGLAAGIAGLAVVAGVTFQPGTAAALNPAPKCEAAKLNESAKKAKCVANAASRAIRKSEAVDAAKLGKCSTKFGEKFTKSEIRAGGACPTDGDASFVEGLVDDCVDDVVTDLGGVPGPGGDEARCQSKKAKEAGKYAQCKFKASSKGIKKGLAPDFTKCDTKLAGKWARLEASPPCSTSGDLTSVKAAIDACHDTVAAALTGDCGNGSLDAGEECDDGNSNNGDGCSDQCVIEFACGDGNVDAGEECDDGNTASGDGCSDQCTSEAPPPSLLGATATASTSGAAGGANLAVDGNLATRWESAHGVDPSWITLDLGDDYALSEVIIHWEAANAATYEIQGSANNSSWVTLSSQSGGVFGDRTDNVGVTGTYRYVRMNGLTRTSPYGYSIWEMEVYGTPAADTDGDGVDDSKDLCPGTPPGSTVDADGCIFVDTDNDGVKDSLDLCPGTPPSTPVDANGCAIVIPVNEVTSINDILAGGAGASQPGFSLYVFDDDLAAPGTSTCNGGCATSWPPLLVSDGAATGVSNLGTIVRSDSTVQATYDGRPLYFYVGDSAPGDTNGDGAGGVWHTVAYVQVFTPLFDDTTVLEPELQEDTPTALITHLADRARDRHAREDQFMQYDHYLSFYWEHRTAEIEIVDTIGKGGNTITFNVTTEWQLSSYRS